MEEKKNNKLNNLKSYVLIAPLLIVLLGFIGLIFINEQNVKTAVEISVENITAVWVSDDLVIPIKNSPAMLKTIFQSGDVITPLESEIYRYNKKDSGLPSGYYAMRVKWDQEITQKVVIHIDGIIAENFTIYNKNGTLIYQHLVKPFTENYTSRLSEFYLYPNSNEVYVLAHYNKGNSVIGFTDFPKLINSSEALILSLEASKSRQSIAFSLLLLSVILIFMAFVLADRNSKKRIYSIAFFNGIFGIWILTDFDRSTMWILETFKLIPTVAILIISIVSVNYVSCAFVKMNGYFFEKSISKKMANILFIIALTLGTAEVIVDLIRLVTWNETLVLMKGLFLTTNNWIIIIGSLILLVLSIYESYQGSSGAIVLSIGLSICLITFFVSQTTELLISHWGVIALSAAMAVVLTNRYKVSQQNSKWDTEMLKLRNREMEMLYLDLDYAQTELLLRLGSIFDVRSHESSAHVHRVAEYTKLISLKLELPESDIELISKASALHDIGKVGTPDAILNAPGKLSEKEFDEMKCHARVGFEILNGSMVEILDLAAVISLTHHERYDGKGYPDGLVGEEIPIQGAIVAAADVFDALLSSRVYKKAWTLDDVIQYFEAESGKHFNPQIAQIIIDYRSEFEAIINTLPYET